MAMLSACERSLAQVSAAASSAKLSVPISLPSGAVNWYLQDGAEGV